MVPFWGFSQHTAASRSCYDLLSQTGMSYKKRQAVNHKLENREPISRYLPAAGKIKYWQG